MKVRVFFVGILIVGPGGSPDENGETMIDALVMDGVIIINIFHSMIPFTSRFRRMTLKYVFLGYSKDIHR